MILQAETAFPKECCAFLGGKNYIFTHYYSLQNRAQEPTKNFFADPAEILQALQTMQHLGQNALGIYHSHPKSIAYPSSKDIKSAYYPEATYFIFSLQPPQLAAFHIEQEKVTSVDFCII